MWFFAYLCLKRGMSSCAGRKLSFDKKILSRQKAKFLEEINANYHRFSRHVEFLQQELTWFEFICNFKSIHNVFNSFGSASFCRAKLVWFQTSLATENEWKKCPTPRSCSNFFRQQSQWKTSKKDKFTLFLDCYGKHRLKPVHLCNGHWRQCFNIQEWTPTCNKWAWLLFTVLTEDIILF